MGREYASNEGEATRAVLMDMAERLFALNGIASTSIRSINDAAGQGAASVHYHFRTKGALLEAILLRRGETMMAAIAARADELLNQPERPGVRDLVGAVFAPHAKLIRDDPVHGGYWEQIISQLSLKNDPLLDKLSGEITEKLRRVLERCCPDVEAHARWQRWNIAVLSMINLLGIHGSQSSGTVAQDARLTEGFLESVEEFVTAGLEGSLLAARAS
jgi:AcrR family transcriptional regulator